MDWEQANGDREPRMQGPIQNLPRHGPAVADGATTWFAWLSEPKLSTQTDIASLAAMLCPSSPLALWPPFQGCRRRLQWSQRFPIEIARKNGHLFIHPAGTV